jgi:hypothetical protein
MPGYSQKTLNYKVANGNAVVIQFGDQVVGFAQSSVHGVDFGSDALYGIGSSLPGEIQQLKILPTLSLDTLMLTETGLQAFNQPSTWLEILANTQLDFHIIDGATGDVILTYKNATAGSYSSTIPANQPITETMQFNALDVWDSNGDSVLASNSTNILNTAASTVGNFVAGAVGG